ncbi:MAG TPA: phosphate acyltransferase PlsX [Acidimicrobiia bacterium]|nr:phosphate acyltransferase PlsX [Acidimicrobiia bacterium]
MTTIALDAMGGDRAPGEILAGAKLAASDGVDLVLVGDRSLLEPELERLEAELPIVNATEAIGMGEDPARALREKPDASISVAARLVRDRSAGAFVSAGSTGAAMAAAVITVGRAQGVLRPALASVIPTPETPTLILDCGANTEVKAEHLIQFGVMGSVAAEVFFGMVTPRVGLLNIGEEPGKGRALEKEAFRRMTDAPFNFIGNVEGRDLGGGKADVIVTDGFVGNVALKTTEGIAQMVSRLVVEATSSLPADLRERLLDAFSPVGSRLDYENTGGAHLLGVNGVVVIAHGSSGRVAVANALRMARDGLDRDLVGEMKRRLADAAHLVSARQLVDEHPASS